MTTTHRALLVALLMAIAAAFLGFVARDVLWAAYGAVVTGAWLLVAWNERGH